MNTAKKKTTKTLASGNKSDSPAIDNDSLNTAANTVGSGNIDKIREILFGVQIKDFEKRFLRIEDRMVREIKDIRDEVKKSLDSLENYIKQEVESLSDSIDDAKDARNELEKQLNKELTDSSKFLEKKLSKLDDQHTKSTREIRQQLLDQSKTLSEEIRQKYEDNTTALERASEELNINKIDNTRLAEMLTDMAMRLTNDPAMKLNLKDLENE